MNAILAPCIIACAHAASLAEPTAYATELASLVNAYRAAKNAAPLAAEDTLSTIAREHSAAMARAHKLSHDDFQSRFRRSAYSMCVENVGWNYATAPQQLEAWQQSPGHDRNLLDARVTHAGVGVAGDYVTLIACR